MVLMKSLMNFSLMRTKPYNRAGGSGPAVVTTIFMNQPPIEFLSGFQIFFFVLLNVTFYYYLFIERCCAHSSVLFASNCLCDSTTNLTSICHRQQQEGKQNPTRRGGGRELGHRKTKRIRLEVTEKELAIPEVLRLEEKERKEEEAERIRKEQEEKRSGSCWNKSA